jgi:predicted N-acyltransferase
VPTTVRIETRIAKIDRAAWDRLDHGPSPFLRHGFLTALEGSGSVGRGSGWAPAYVLVEEDGALVGATAAWVKGHSYGEYIFDWSWASAARRFGVEYYPKVVVAAPMTPANGARILLAPGVDADRVSAAVIAGVRAVADDVGASSVHWLFCTEDEERRLRAAGFEARATFQFHWRDRGYRTFDDFLGALASRKRKQIRKERARVHAAIEGITWVPGRELTADQLDALDVFYRTTVEEHGGHDYLRPGFFHRLAKELPDETLFAEVRAGGARIAGALFFETPQGLYGRYWGSERQLEFLHFETAYYAGIERCIARGIPLFEAGAQGEHKLLRGFEPALTRSAHWMRDPRFHAAIADFLARERGVVARQMEELAEAGPYRSTS